MTFDVAYPWLKALHVAAALAFVGGVLIVSVVLAAMPSNAAQVQSIARVIRRWDQAVTTPAMLLVWAFGLTLAIKGEWFPEHWLQIKVVVVVVLSGLHGVLSGRLRRVAGGKTVNSRLTAPVVLGCATAIALLAVIKPF